MVFVDVHEAISTSHRHQVSSTPIDAITIYLSGATVDSASKKTHVLIPMYKCYMSFLTSKIPSWCMQFSAMVPLESPGGTTYLIGIVGNIDELKHDE